MKAYINQLHNSVKQSSSPIYFVTITSLILALVAFVGLLIDDRILLGVNVWLKPLKFAISTAIYVFTFGYLLTLYPYTTRKRSVLNNIVAWTLLVEFLIIFYQGFRGVQSHYNMSSNIDGLLFAAMGILIGINVLIMVVMLIDTIRLKMKTPKSVQWAILLGWIIILVGSWVGGQMISQMSHNIAIADGSEGLPFVNWSTIAGDLRVAHFFGLHGLQIIPLLAFFLSKKWKTNDTRQVVAVTIFGLAYAAWIGFTFYQAKQGMPFIQL